jgi:hypothetical protein
MITMARPQTMTLFTLAIAAIFLFSVTQPATAADTRPPNIYGWGFEGQPELGQGFGVWANITDDETGVRNATVEVFGPNMTLSSPMSFNGTYYTGLVPAFPNAGTFGVRIRAYDLANNTRTSAFRYVVYESNPLPTIPEGATLLIVVGSSIGLMVMVVAVALVYDRRKGP